MTIKELAMEAITTDPKTIGDRKYLIAWVWTKEDAAKKHLTEEEIQVNFKKIYKYLLNHEDPDSIIRAKEKALEEKPHLKYTKEDTETVRRAYLGDEQELPLNREESKKKLSFLMNCDWKEL